MRTLWQDIRYGIRMLVKKPGFTAVVVLTLALGIGANTTIFSFLDRVVLRPLSVKKPRELVKLECQYQYQHGNHSGVGKDDKFTYPLYVSYRDQSDVFSGLIAYTSGKLSSAVRVGDSVERVALLSVSSNYFSVLGIRPVMGRFFLPEEEREQGAQSVAVISHGLWRRLFDGDPAVLGRTISISNHIFTVVGVTPPEFTGTVAAVNPGVYVTLGALRQLDNFAWDNPGNFSFYCLGRLNTGVSRAQAEARLLVLTEQINQGDSDRTAYTNLMVKDGSRGTNEFAHEGYWWLVVTLFQAPTMLILLVACANVANILLARGMMRQREIAIRRAMGAHRSDIIRQLLVECSLLALLSGACGALLTHWLTLTLCSALPIIQQLGLPVGVDGRIFCLTLLGSLGSVFLFGLVPALQVSRPNVMSVLKDDAGTVMLFARRCNLRNILVVTQVAVSVIVLSFGVLCLLSLRALQVADPGYDHRGVLAVSFDVKDELPVNIDFRQLLTHLQERVTSLPGVKAVSLASGVPLTATGRTRTGAGYIEDYQKPADRDYIPWDYTTVAPGYFQTLGVPLLRGRDFTSQDGPGTSRVMIINELMAQRFWPGQDPIGKHVDVGGGPREVIGVVKAVKFRNIRERPGPLSFWPLEQFDASGKPSPAHKWDLLIRVHGDRRSLVSLLQGELESVGLTPATYKIGTLAERASELHNPQRVITAILTLIGALGLLFVATGIAGVMAFEVSQRTREIGVRMALGAQWKDVLRFVLRKGAILTGIGLGLGLGLSCIPCYILFLLVPDFRFVDEYALYGVHMWDPLTYLCVILLVSTIMLAACYVPARRAARIDPMIALRYE
ncbi:MAG: ABC transporter permease [Sedimentisphaerales bacterium]|nr:ABC transporter permease [Sedimentisphaerales bacterium]